MVEPFSILGAIAAAIQILANCKKVYDIAHGAIKHYEPFAMVAENIPVVLNILQNVEAVLIAQYGKAKRRGHVTAGQELRDAEKAMKSIIATCRTKCDDLHIIFRKVMCDEQTTRLGRYIAAIRSLKPGRVQKVNDLMCEILKKIHLLKDNFFFEAALRSVDSRLRRHLESLYQGGLARLMHLFRTLAAASRLPLQEAAVGVIAAPWAQQCPTNLLVRVKKRRLGV